MASNIGNDDELIVGINVTPLVDVVLVLLIIFMVTATYIVAQSIPVDLPEAGTGEDVVTTLAITITSDAKLYIDGKPVDEATISSTIAEAKAENADVRVIIAADKAVLHGKVIHIIDVVRKEGVTKFAINIEAQEEDDNGDLRH